MDRGKLFRCGSPAALTVALALFVASLGVAFAQRPDAFSESRSHPAIDYNRRLFIRRSTISIASWRKAGRVDVRSGERLPPFDARRAARPDRFQMLVYTQTSMQAPKINRAIRAPSTSTTASRWPGSAAAASSRPGRRTRVRARSSTPSTRSRRRPALRPAARVRHLPRHVGHAGCSGSDGADDVPTKDPIATMPTATPSITCGYRGAVGRLVCDRPPRAAEAHGEPAPLHGAAVSRLGRPAVGGWRVRSGRLPHAVQRHRGADGVRASDADDESHDARRLGIARRRAGPRRFSGRRPRASAMR